MKAKTILFVIWMILAGQVLAIDLNGTWYTGSKNGLPTLTDPDSNTFTWGTDAEPPVPETASSGFLWTYFTDLELSNVGDSITIRFDLAFIDAFDSSGNAAIRFGLFDNGGSTLQENISGANSDSAFSSSTGYWANWPLEPGSPGFYARPTPAPTSPLSTSQGSPVNLGTQAVGAEFQLVTGVSYPVTFTITRYTATSYQLTSSIYNTSISTMTDLITASTFNSFYLLNTPQSGVGSMTFSNVGILYNVQASNPDPTSGDDNVPLEVTLSWNTGLDADDPSQLNSQITQHHLFMDSGNPADPNMYYIDSIDAGNTGGGPEPTASYDLSDLSRDRTYLWRIDEAPGPYGPGDPNNIIGQVWSFDTVLSVPDIKGHPEDQLVDPGQDAVFTVYAVNPLADPENPTEGLRYHWYRGLPEDTTNSVGTDSPTLTIADGMEGYYYCQVEIISNEKTTDSQAALLTVKQLIAHWPFDGDPNDATGNGYNGTASGDPGYTDGLIGEAIDLDGSDDKIVHALSVEVAIPAFTLSLWAWTDNTAQANNSSLMNNNASTSDFQIGITSGNYAYQGSQTVVFAPIPETPQWVHLAATCDGTATRIFYNGEYAGDADVADNVFGQFAIGVNRGDNTFFEGKIDDVRLYNYVLSDIEIALEYTTPTNGEACAESHRPRYDLDGDCDVDLADFARVASEWMECGWVPDCL